MRWLSFCVALTATAVALLSSLDGLGKRFFFAHMIQHELFVYVVPVLLILSRPLAFATTVLRGRARAWLEASLRGEGAVGRIAAVLCGPIVAFALSTVILWAWHAPRLYDLALRNEIAHVMEHASFLGVFLLYWTPVLGGAPGRPGLRTNAGRALYLIAGATQAGLLGALITLSTQVLYLPYLEVADPAVLSVLADQQLGGAIMWFSGPLFFGAAAALVMR